MNESATGAKRPLLHEIMAKSAVLQVPLQVTLELTYRCNLRCAHCYIDIKNNNELSFDEWRLIIKQLEEAGTLYLLLTGGEILVRPDFMEIASYARKQGFYIGLLTNCTMVTREIAQQIARLGLFSLGTSLYGATAASHERVTRIQGSFQKTIEGVKHFIDAGMKPTVQIVPMKSNVSELLKVKELVEGLGAKASIKIGMAPTKTGADFPLALEPTSDDWNQSGWHPDPTEKDADCLPELCKAGKGICSISPTGDVFPCIMFPMKLGNVREAKFNSIWSLEPCDELRYLRSMRRSDLYACSGCERKADCQRCSGSAYIESGRMNGPSPSACRQAQVRGQLNKSGKE